MFIIPTRGNGWSSATLRGKAQAIEASGGRCCGRVTYDPRYNIAYLRFREKVGPVETLKLSDWNHHRHRAGRHPPRIELNANEQLTAADAGRLVVVDPAGKEHSIPLAC